MKKVRKMARKKRKRRCLVVNYAFPIKGIAKLLGMSVDKVKKRFIDGRVASPWAEEKAEEMIPCFQCHEDFNVPGSDGTLLANIVAVRCLTKSTGVKFQDSKYIGFRRPCSQENLLDSIRGVDNFIVVDVVDPDCWRFILLSSETVYNWAQTETTRSFELTPSGLKKEKFDKFLERDCTIEAG